LPFRKGILKMKRLIVEISLILVTASLAAAQDLGYYCIYGNRDGSTVDVYIDSFIEIENWVATPVGVIIGFMHNPLASDDVCMVSRDGGEVIFPADTCGEFWPPNTNSPPGYTNQSLLGLYDTGPYYCPALNTDGDTIHIANFFMHTANDSSLMGQTVCPFIEGYNPAHGLTLWGDIDGTTSYIPDLIFSCLYFVEYLAGDANGSGDVSGADVTYMVNYCKGFGPSPDPIFAGDANGDCLANGMDVVYLVAYFRGGPEPFLGSCH
jgi:hypothetical protein